MSDLVESIPGSDSVIRWFGRWPSFHDAEVLAIELRRDKPSRIVLVAWNTADSPDQHGYFQRQRDAEVTITLERIADMALEDFDSQNVLASVVIEPVDSRWRITLNPLSGIGGWLIAEKLSIACIAVSSANQSCRWIRCRFRFRESQL